MKNKIVESLELESLIKEGRLDDAIRIGSRQVKWLFNNSSRNTMVIEEKLVWKIVYNLKDRIKELENPTGMIKDYGSNYDKNFGDDRKCKCGHSYSGHFDYVENMRHIGCKYCSCYDFKEDVPAIPVQL